MLHKLLITVKPWQSAVIKILVYILLCIATLLFLLCMSAVAVTNIDTPDYILIPLTTAILILSSFMDSFILSKIFKENGLITGIYIGLIFLGIILLLSVYYNTFSFTNIFITKMLSVISAGMLGGILGVNF